MEIKISLARDLDEYEISSISVDLD